MTKISLLTFILFLSFGCLVDKSKLAVSFQDKTKKRNVVGNVTYASISSVQIINNQLVINGNGLTDVANVKVDGSAFSENFTIESKTATKIIANSIRAFSFDVSKVFNVVLSDANASATFPIDFSLCNATLNGRGFDCAAPIADKDVLSYDAISGKWKPRAVSGLNYLGAFNASSNPATGPATQPAGAYYIISASGSIAGIPFTIGDWLVSNGSAWQKIDNSTAVLSVFGRNGAVTAQTGDYSLNMLGDVSFPTAPVAGKVLKFDGTNWVAGDDLSGGGAGSVNTAEIADGAVTDAKIATLATSKLTGTISSAQITDGTIVNADINAAAAIDYSKLNIADGDIPAAKISGLPVLSSILAASITDGDTTHAPTGEAVYEALQTKLGTSGGTLSVGTISGVPTPVGPSDIVNKAYVDDAITNVDAFTEGAVLATDLAGLNTGVNGPITAADTVLGAFGKMQYQVTDLKAKGLWDKTVNDIAYTAGNVSIDKKLRLKSDNANYVELLSPNALASTYTLTFPANDGNANQVLKTDGAGVLAWVDVNDATVQAFAKSALPTCAAGEVLKSNGTTFSCITDNTGAGAFSGTADRAVLTTAGGALGVSATTSTELGYVSGVTSSIQTQINGKQATDATLTALAAYNTNGILVQTTADTFVGRSIAGTANRVTVTDGDGVSGNPTVNIPTALLPSPVVGDVGKFLKATAADTSVWSALGLSDVTTALGYTPLNNAGETVTTGTFTFNNAAVLRTLNPIAGTDVANKQYVDSVAGLWQTNGTDVHRLNGNVGVGTTTPFYKLDVTGTMRVLNGAVAYENSAASSAASSLSFWKSRNYAANITNDEIGYFNFYGHDGTGLYRSAFIASNVDATPSSATHSVPGRLSFYTTPAGSTDSSERMRIDSTGNVGIGTTAPLGKLDINWGGANGFVGGADINAATRTNNTNKWFRYGQTQYANANTPFLAIMTGSTSTENGVYFGGGTATQPNATALRFYTGTSQSTNGSAVERMTINSTGSVGIGTTNPGAKLALEGTGAVGFQMKTTSAAAVDTMNLINDMDANGNFWFAKGTTSTAAPAAADKLMNLTNEGNLEIYGQQVNGTTDASGVLALKTQATATGGTKNEVSMEFYADRANINTMSGFVGYESGTAFDMTMKNTKAGSLILGTNNTDNITILSDGRTGIGTSTPQTHFHVKGAAEVEYGGVDTYGTQLVLAAFGYPASYTHTIKTSHSNTVAANNSMKFSLSTTAGNAVTDIMTLLGSGYVGIGTTTPVAKLDISASTTLASNGTGPNMYLRNTQSANNDYLAMGWLAEDTWGIISADSGTHRNFAIQPYGGAVGIGTISPSYTLHVNGSVAGTGAYNSLSDRRLKKDIEVIPNSLEKISALRGVSFNWDRENHPELKLNDRGELGVIAQEVQKVFPNAVTVDKKTGILSVAYSMLIAPLIEAVKDLFSDSKELKREIASLKKDNELKAEQIKKNAEENQELKKRLDKIEKLLNKSK